MNIEPGQTIGIVGGGQLGRMFAQEARRTGYRTVIYTDEPPGSPAGQVADLEINAPYHAGRAAEQFASEIDVATYEFENIPADFLLYLEAHTVVRPGRLALETCQHREREKNFLREAGLPCVDFIVVDSADALRTALEQTGTPAILKTAAFGYDGKGQVRIDHPNQVADAWSSLGAERAVLEAFARFQSEVSVVAARDMQGGFTAFPVVENEHRRHILDTSLAPARIPAETAKEAVELTRRVADALDCVGTLTVEFFVTADRLLINEIAPRPHNSGHWTIDACSISQFGLQLLAITGRPVEQPVCHSPAVMVNLLGELWPPEPGEPDWNKITANPLARLHLYGKKRARQGRKMGHFTVLGDPPGSALVLARGLRDSLADD